MGKFMLHSDKPLKQYQVCQLLVHCRQAAGPKISIFLTLHIVTRAAYSSPSEAPMGNAGDVVKFFTFTMAWKRFCCVSEVSGLIHKYNNHMIFD